MRTLQMGSRGDDVRRLQARLNELGDYGLAEDGIFGAMTRSAVVKFQRSRGLADDGIAGPITLGALGLTDSSPTGGPSGSGSPGRRRRSLHIGVNRVDPAHYEGWDGALSGCENDAATMRAIATRDGFTPTTLLTQNATAANVLAEISAAAQQLASGDIFLLTYAGHGAQVPNVSGDNEIDLQDETWVLFERMLIDDELESAFSGFAAGVDIVLLSDSCHSGTVYRRMFTRDQLEFAERKGAFYVNLSATSGGGSRSFPRPASPGGSRSVEVTATTETQRSLFSTSAATFWEKLKAGAGWTPASGPYVSIFDRFERTRTREAPLEPRRFPGQQSTSRGGGTGPSGPVLTRNMPIGVNAAVVARHAALYAGLQAGARGQSAVRANGVSISGCLDSQLSQEVGGNGVFTTTLHQVWNSSSFSGNFRQFHQAIVARMGPTQTPELGLWGANAESLAAKTPFG
ncbi:caspase family protein [Microbacterium sp. BK668]|uniref:caspase family protein n=1 Tax=Microbacterium sp. BK668 TaxID=2512118 RepID=UPI00105D423F|nr:caspase family protein [Microbacterium sp. BK668]TDN90926.1 putative peptidoglycan binding protein [Microbacterium sp. BK668]